MKRRARKLLDHFKTRHGFSTSTMSCCWSPVVLLLLACVLAEAAEAKRGCALYGHSCYGGMGKRAPELLDTNEEGLQSIDNPAFVFTGPRSEDRIQRLTPQQYDSISRIIRQWILSYKKAQQDMHD